MLGTLACGKTYCGNDINNIVVSESNNIYKWLSKLYDVPDAYMNVGDAKKFKADFKCLFTCSPYGSIEQWPGIENDNLSCDEWIDICLDNFNCETYLFVTDDKISKWKENIVETIENRSHFSKNKEYIVLISK